MKLAHSARVFVDVGSHTGLYTLVGCATNPCLRVFAFEPVPEVRTQLIKNIEASRFAARCVVRSEALSDHCGTQAFHVPVSCDMASLDPNGFHGLPGRVIKVDVATVDSLLDQEIKVDLVKIDVEGFEDGVLRGMRRILETSKPRIIFECLTQQLANKVTHVLDEFGYTFYQLGQQGVEPVARVIPDPNNGSRNFLAEKLN